MSETRLQSAWQQALTIDLIAEPLYTCRPTDNAKSVYEKMVDQNWASCGFISDTAHDQQTLYVEREQIREADFTWHNIAARPFNLSELVGSYTAIRDCLPRLVQHKRIFLLGRHGVDKIATLADLRKHPAKLSLFGIITTLEMSLTRRLQRDDVQDSVALLSEKRVAKARELYELRKQDDEEIDLIDCLQLKDKATVLMKKGEFSDHPAISSNTKAERYFKGLEKLRNQLAHSQDPGRALNWEEIAAIVATAEQLITQLNE